jgi:release factor glutamine methyltransferase
MVTSKVGGQSIRETLDGLHSRLEKTSDTPGLDAQVLLAYQMGKPRSWILAHPEEIFTRGQMTKIEKLASRLSEGEPLAYILEAWEFFGMEFHVTQDVLIPRPETELLVERAINWLKKVATGNEKLKVLDVGTGSGCISIALAVNVPNITITATDISSSALKIASGNAASLNVSDRINFIEADLFPNYPTPAPYSLVVANLPYIPTATLEKTTVYRREPTLALDGGSDGLATIRRFWEKASRWILLGGTLLCEIEASEGAAAKSMASIAFPTSNILVHKDLSGHERLLEVQT